ncbi:MAG TPA: ubiquitin-like domain-containing protein [Dehalococcoidia bacterium]
MTYWLEGAPVRPQARQSQLVPHLYLNLISSTRARLRLSLFLCLAFAGLLGFIVFPPRRLVISADNGVSVLVSRETDVASLLESAGVQREAGDVLLRSGDQIKVERAVPVVVEVDGRALAWRTRAETVQQLLDELAVSVSPYDTLLYNSIEVSATDALYPSPISLASLAGFGVFNRAGSQPEGVVLSVVRAVPLTIVEDGRAMPIQSSRPTVEMALQDAGIRLGPADEVYPAASTAVTAGLQVEVKHAKAISLRVGGSTNVIYTQQDTLQAALAEIGLFLGPEDRVEPALDATVTNDMTARLVRVSGRQLIERRDVQRRTVFRPDAALAALDSRIVKGHDGVRFHESRIVIEDGVEVEKTLVKEWFDPEPADNVIYYSTASIEAVGFSPDNLSVARTERMYATWYNAASAGKASTDPGYGITASGVPVTRGIVAVDPKVIRLGTRLYIPGYGFAVAGDTGGGIIGNMVDLGYADGEPVDWRTGWVEVYILGP